MTAFRAYEPNPRYPAVDGVVEAGLATAIGGLPAGPVVVAIEGPAVLGWDELLACVADILGAGGRTVEVVDMRRHLAPWPAVLARTASPELDDDPDFATLPAGTLRDLFDELPSPESAPDRLTLVVGPGAALVAHDVLWYADLPKRFAEAAIGAGTARNLGQPDDDGPGTTRRLFYVDWPLLDRHRDSLVERIDLWIDAREPARPTYLDGRTLRRTMADLARRPFRTRPTFNTVSWGGHWGQRVLGLNRDARNTGVGYELIAPESGVLIGDGPEAIEVPFQVVVASNPVEMLGPAAHADFGTSFPIRFDYLDTVDGGSLSVHCHPLAEYMRRVFGWPYTQHETYYVMVGGERSKVFLGLREGVDVDAFHHSAHEASDHGRPFDIEHFVQTFPATPHQLFAIPAGTPHGSGKGNVILEVSATPYLYSLRFYDWLRRDEHGRQRPVHVQHAFSNLNRKRMGQAVSDELVRPATTIREGTDWREELLADTPEMFYSVQRLVLEPGGAFGDDTAGRFHVLNVVEGPGVHVQAGDRFHDLAYAETLVVPAAVGAYEVRNPGTERVRVVKALVR